MADGAAGRPGVPAQEVKGQEADSVPTRPPAGEAVTASGGLRRRSHARTQACSTYSESQQDKQKYHCFFSCMALCWLFLGCVTPG